MRILLQSRSWYIFGAIIMITIALGLLASVFTDQETDYVTTTVTRSTIAELVSVSGVVEAQNTANLAFPSTGIVTDVFVDEGDYVEANTILTTLASARLVAEKAEAEASLAGAQADLDELLAGPRTEVRAVADVSVINAEANLQQVVLEQNEQIENARQTLLSSSLTARSIDNNETAIAPVVSGTYTCEIEGRYNISVFSSNSPTGYSYRVTGLENATYAAFMDSPGSFGNCGLFLQFTSGQSYNNSEWVIDIPNAESSTYLTNLNTYQLLSTQAANAIEAAENSLALVREEALLSNAPARLETIARAKATVAGARSRIAVVTAELADRSIIAPFAGIVTNVDILPGETSPTTPVITLLAEDDFELLVRIPEIDITKIAPLQSVDIVFDAQSEEVVTGIVDFISPLAVEIDGVAYFEATVLFDNPPTWLRSGLNADVTIIVSERVDTLVLPKRFLLEEDGAFYVLLPAEPTPRKERVERGFIGNDGQVEIIGLAAGTTVVAP